VRAAPPTGVSGEKPTKPACRQAGEGRHPEARSEAWIPAFAGNDESDESAVVRGFPREHLIKPPFVLSLSKHERKKARNHGPVTTAPSTGLRTGFDKLRANGSCSEIP
jgi:hypothetical protein